MPYKNYIEKIQVNFFPLYRCSGYAFIGQIDWVSTGYFFYFFYKALAWETYQNKTKIIKPNQNKQNKARPIKIIMNYKTKSTNKFK